MIVTVIPSGTHIPRTEVLNTMSLWLPYVYIFERQHRTCALGPIQKLNIGLPWQRITRLVGR